MRKIGKTKLLIFFILLLGLSVFHAVAKDEDKTPEDFDFKIPKMELVIKKDKNITIFVGKLTDDDFPKGISIFDAYVMPEECAKNKEDIKENILDQKKCDGIISFSINSGGGYDISIIKKARIIIASCTDENNDCEVYPEKLKIGFVSNRTFARNDPPKNYKIADLNKLIKAEVVHATVTPPESTAPENKIQISTAPENEIQIQP